MRLHIKGSMHNGSKGKGYHIMRVDMDAANNSIENLQPESMINGCGTTHT